MVGFYLISLGFVTLFLTSSARVTGAREVFELISVKVGTVALVLGAMHLVNVLVFNGIRRRHLNDTRRVPEPVPYARPAVNPFHAP